MLPEWNKGQVYSRHEAIVAAGWARIEAQFFVTSTRACMRVKIFDGLAHMLANQKALLAKFVSLTYADSRAKWREATRNNFTA